MLSVHLLYTYCTLTVPKMYNEYTMEVQLMYSQIEEGMEQKCKFEYDGDRIVLLKFSFINYNFIAGITYEDLL
jgi:hypothetical protein